MMLRRWLPKAALPVRSAPALALPPRRDVPTLLRTSDGQLAEDLPQFVRPSSEAQQARVPALSPVQPLPCKHMLPGHLIHGCTAHALFTVDVASDTPSHAHTSTPGQPPQRSTGASRSSWSGSEQVLERHGERTVVCMDHWIHIVLCHVISFALPLQCCSSHNTSTRGPSDRGTPHLDTLFQGRSTSML